MCFHRPSHPILKIIIKYALVEKSSHGCYYTGIHSGTCRWGHTELYRELPKNKMFRPFFANTSCGGGIIAGKLS